jgi:hypothetical protein
MTAPVANRIWNRAALGSDPATSADLRSGDRALRALLLAHSLIMNGGVFHCVHEVLSEPELEAAIEGYALFGFDGVADELRDAAAIEDPWAESHEVASIEFDARYAAAIPTDAVVADRFEIRLATQPEDFAPVYP